MVQLMCKNTGSNSIRKAELGTTTQRPVLRSFQKPCEVGVVSTKGELGRLRIGESSGV